MHRVIGILHRANLLFFMAIVWIGVSRYLAGRDAPASLIALAVAIVGPLEDVLKTRVRKGAPPQEEPAVEAIDKGTSAVFLALLLWVLLMLS